MFAQSGHLDVFAFDAKPDAALGEVEGEAETEDEENGGRPDEE